MDVGVVHSENEVEMSEINEECPPQKSSHLDIAPSIMPRWRRVGTSQGLDSNTAVADFLLRLFEKDDAGEQREIPCKECGAKLILWCSACHSVEPDVDLHHIPPSCLASVIHEGESNLPHISDQDCQRKSVHYCEDKKISNCSNIQLDSEDVPESKKPEEPNSSDENTDNETDGYETGDNHQCLKAPSSDHPLQVQQRKSHRILNVKKSQMQHECPVCASVFKAAKDLNNHIKMHKPKREYVCPKCEKTFKYQASFNTHLRQHGNTQSFKCGSCQESFTSIKSLVQHMEAHTDDQTCSCIACDREFQNPDLLKDHTSNHCQHKSKLFSCTHCEETISSQRDLKAHRITNHFQRADMKNDRQRKFRHTSRLASASLKTASKTASPEGGVEAKKHTVDQSPKEVLPTTENKRRGRPSKTKNRRDPGVTRPSDKVKETCTPVNCRECGAKVSRARDLKIHMRVHTGEKPYACDDCHKTFRHRASYNLHLKQKCNGGNVLQKRQTEKSTRNVVLVTETDSGLIKLEQGDDSFMHESEMFDETENRDSSSVTVDPIERGACGSVEVRHSFFGSQDDVKEEGVQQTGVVETNFDQTRIHLEEVAASQQFKLQEHLQGEHISEHPDSTEHNPSQSQTNVQTFEFDQLTQKYTLPDQSSLSLQRVSQRTASRVSDLSESVTHTGGIARAGEAKKHDQLSQRQRGRRPTNTDRCVSCHVCGVKISRQRDLKIHMRIHSGEKPYLCSECGEEFRQAAGLVAHNVRKHSGQRPYVCDQCGAAFPLVGSLNQHMRIHNDIKGFTCHECGKSFLRSSDLKGHIARHLGIKKFPCDKCKKMFSTSSELTKHKSLHTGEKPYSCSECRKRFRLQKSLKRHIRTHVKDSYVKDSSLANCGDCDKIFSNTDSYVKDSSLANCGDCDKAFSNTDSTISSSHCQLHTVRGDTSVYSCSDCAAGFFDAASLLQHQSDMHGWSSRGSHHEQPEVS